MLVEKYRPHSMEELVLNSDIKNSICSKLKNKTIDNLLLCGKQGIGKTTLARIIADSIGASTLYINAGYESSIDDIRIKVKQFCDMQVMLNTMKVVIIDEADSLSSSFGNGSNAQGALRNIIEESESDTRFILTCNYLDKIIAPIQSRCFPLQLAFTPKDVLAKVCEIIKKEQIKYTADSIKQFNAQVINKLFPDIRLILNTLDKWIIDSELKVTAITCDNSIPANQIYEMLKNKTKSMEIRQWYTQHETEFSNDYVSLSSALFNLMEDPMKQIDIAESIYRMSVCLDKEVQFYAMILRMSK